MNNFERILQEGLLNKVTLGKAKLKYPQKSGGENKAEVASPKQAAKMKERAAEKERVDAIRRNNIKQSMGQKSIVDQDEKNRIAAKREKAKKAGMLDKKVAPKQDYSKSPQEIISTRKKIDSHNRLAASYKINNFNRLIEMVINYHFAI